MNAAQLGPGFFEQLFDQSPRPCQILKADEPFHIVAVNERSLSDLRASLNRVVNHHRADLAIVRKHDVPLRDGNGVFESDTGVRSTHRSSRMTPATASSFTRWRT